MFGALKAFYRRHNRIFAGLFVALTVVSWLLGPALLNVLNLQQSLLVSLSVVVILLSAIQDYLHDLTSAPRGFAVAGNQNENNRSLARLVTTHRPLQVRMIEYDSESTKFFIAMLLEHGATVQCLLQHPDVAVNERQRQRTILQILSVKEQYFDCLDRISFSYYREPASVRGRRIDDRYLYVGWYTYDRRDRARGSQVWGHTNPVIETDLRTPVGWNLARFFDQVFDNLSASSVPWEDALAEVIRDQEVIDR